MASIFYNEKVTTMPELIPDTFYRETSRDFGYVLSIQGERDRHLQSSRCWGVVTTYVDTVPPVGRFVAVLSFEVTSPEAARDLFFSLPPQYLDGLADTSQEFLPSPIPTWALKAISDRRLHPEGFTYPQPVGNTKELIKMQKDLLEQARVRVAVSHFRAHRQSDRLSGLLGNNDVLFAKLYELFRIFGVKSISEACEIELQLTREMMQVSEWSVLVTRLKRYGLISGR
jgi:hypothetical protein